MEFGIVRGWLWRARIWLLTPVIHVIHFNTKEIRMAQEALKAAVAAIRQELSEVKDGVDRVIAALSQPDPDVEAAVAELNDIKAGFDSVESSIDAAVPPPAPPAEG